MKNNTLIFSIIAALAISNISFGMMTQVIPLAMDAEGDSRFLIGLNGFAGQLGVLLAGFNLTRLRQRFNSHALVMVAMGIALFAFVGFSTTGPLWWWFGIRPIIGFAMALIFTTGESWLQQISGDKARGRVMGIYMSAQTLAFGTGPFLLPYTGISSVTPWLVCLVPGAIGLFLMSRVTIEEIATAQIPASLWSTLMKGKFLFLCIGVTTLFEGAMLTFFVLYAIEAGVGANTAPQLLSAGIALCVFFLFGIGYLGDHWSRRGMVLICALITMVLSLLQIPLINSVWIWPLIVALRAAAFGVYLSGFGLLGDKFRGTELVAASGIVSMLWGLGGGLSPPVVGWLFDLYGLQLLPWCMALCYVPVLVGLAVTRERSDR